jgi:NAD(P)-dependent dehydrogenase (short-subunit alcohol dehydrogenase family)
MGHKEVVVITGASAGVGRATARRFAQEGALVALIARGHAGLEGARREVEAAGGQALVISADVSNAVEIEAAAERIERDLGPIDIWVNDAMTTVFAPFEEITPEEFRRVTEVTYLGFVFGTRAALRRMVPRNRGTIVQVGSALAYRGIPLQSAYCGAKHAIRGFTSSVRTELMHQGSEVWLTMVQMPALNTPQFSWGLNKMQHRSQPVPPIYQPEVAADAIYFAAHHRRREVYVGASTAAVIVGNKVLPSLGDRYLARTGYDSQQFDGPPPDAYRSNLWEPLDEERDFGTHGVFDARSYAHSIELWLSKHKGALFGLGALALGVFMWARK